MARYPDHQGYEQEIDSNREAYSPQDNVAVYYSNDKYIPEEDKTLNRMRAEKFAETETSSGRPTTTLEATEGGKQLDAEHLSQDRSFPIGDDRRVWNHASESYASQTQGDAQTFVVGASERSTFRSSEMPALLNNERVNSINGVPREDLKEIYDRDQNGPEDAFNKICDAELQRDRERLGPTPVPAEAEDFKQREALYEKQLADQAQQPAQAAEQAKPAQAAEPAKTASKPARGSWKDRPRQDAEQEQEHEHAEDQHEP
jgi:hypothetical protein